MTSIEKNKLLPTVFQLILSASENNNCKEFFNKICQYHNDCKYEYYSEGE